MLSTTSRLESELEEAEGNVASALEAARARLAAHRAACDETQQELSSLGTRDKVWHSHATTTADEVFATLEKQRQVEQQRKKQQEAQENNAKNKK